MLTTAQRWKFKDLVTPQDDVLDEFVGWINENLLPEDVFPQTMLDEWAFANGFRKFE